MIVIRCVNEVSIFQIRPPTAKFPGHILCLNDQVLVSEFPATPQGKLTALKAIAAHAVQLGGAIQQIVDIAELP